MSDAPKPFWKDLVGPAIQVVMIAGGIAVFLSNSAGKTDNTATAVAEMKAEMRQSLDKITTKLEGFPGYQERVAQLERRQTNQEGYNGAVDARLNAVEQKTNANQIMIEGIRAASGVKLRN